MSKVYFHLGAKDKKTVFRVRKLLTNEEIKLVLLPGGDSAFEVTIKGGSEDIQRMRDLGKKMPPKVTLKESQTQCIVESKTVSEAIDILLEKRMEWSLNTLALELMVGRQGDVVIDGKEIWVFSDSKEDMRRVMLDVMYDERFDVEFRKDFKIISKYPDQEEGQREDYSQKTKLTFKLTDEDIEYYRSFPSTKNFFFKDEYEHWF